jgi:hypothetical protein
MTRLELWNKIQLAWEHPNCIWELDRRNGYAWYEDNVLYATPGVAIMLAGYDGIDITERFTDRAERAKELGLEWSYLMHMEQALNFLFVGNTFRYNECVRNANEPGLQVQYDIFTFKNLEQIKSLLCGKN